jgi:hypothetical protein
MPSKPQITEAIFTSLVENAIDFLRQSINELESKPKYSVINFCASIELFLKARLFIEHWTLIVEDLPKATLPKLLEGELKTISIDTAIQRIVNMGHAVFRKDAEVCFKELRNHRNKLTHFYHIKYRPESDLQTFQKAVIERCKGWIHLHRLLTEDWKEQFIDYQSFISDLHISMLKQRSFLQAKYEHVLSELEKGRERGARIWICEFCGYEACFTMKAIETLFFTCCRVCEAVSRHLFERCEFCDHEIQIPRDGALPCEFCKNPINLERLLDKYSPDRDPEDIYTRNDRAYCHLCLKTGLQTVVELGGNWICLCCLSVHEKPTRCGWCENYITGIVGTPEGPGCDLCDDLVGYYDNEFGYNL